MNPVLRIPIAAPRNVPSLMFPIQADHLLNALPLIVWTADAHTFRFKFVSEGAERLLGYPAERWLDEPTFWGDHLHPDDRSAIAICHSETHAGRDHELLYRMIAADGREVWLRDKVQVRSERGAAAELSGVMFDVTAEIEAHRALRQSEENYRRMVHFSPDAIGVHRHGRYLYVNPSFARLVGAVDPSDLIGREVMSLIHRDYADVVRDRLRDVAAGKQAPLLQERLNHSGGSSIDVEAMRLPIVFDGVPAIQVVFRDISERLRAEQRYRQIVEGVSDVIYTLDPQGRITSLNRAFETLSGLKIDDWIGRPFTDLLHPDSVERAREHFLQSLHGTSSSIARAYRMRALNGAEMEIETAGQQRVAGDPTHGTIGMARDVTERNVMARRLQESKRLASLGDLAATMAHEMNNVLMAIQPYCELLIRQAGNADLATNAGRSIVTTIDRGKRITSEILEYNTPREPKTEAIEPRAWMNQLTALLEPLLPEGVALMVDSRLRAPIAGDQQHLEQVLTNLAVNAVHAMPDGGLLLLELTEDVEPWRHALGLPSTGRFARLSLRDTGTGIPPSILTQIFDPLFTTKRRGTGLGLAIAKRLVEAQGGAITAESTEGVGTAFHLFLPMASE
jgi:PAS domain S-box-containing protein